MNKEYWINTYPSGSRVIFNNKWAAHFHSGRGSETIQLVPKSEYDKVVQQLKANKCNHKYRINGRCTDCKESLYDLRGF